MKLTAKERRDGVDIRDLPGAPPRRRVKHDLDNLERLAREATTGPWRAGNVETYHVFAPHPNGLAGAGGERVLLRMNQHFPHEADAAFIAAANPATVLALIERIRRLEAMR